MQLSDGYNDLPAGKIANIATSLEMFDRPALRPEHTNVSCTLQRMESPDIDWYRDLFRRVGEPYLWFSALTLPQEQLDRIIRDPLTHVYTVRHNDGDEGLLQLDFRIHGECELLYFGLTAELVGKGAGRWLMNRALSIAWSHPIRRFWVHTCTLDHPSALDFYIRSGFRPYKRQIEIADDPRLTGIYSPSAAPHIPII